MQMFADSVVNIPSSVRLSTDRGAGGDQEKNTTRLRDRYGTITK